MARKKYYDEYGNQVRSKPQKRFYQKVSVWLMVVLLGTIVIITINTFIGKEDILDEPTGSETAEVESKEDKEVDKEVETTEKSVEEQTYTYDDFRGTYVMFEGEPYNSPIVSNILVLGDDFYQTFDRWEFNMTSTILDKTIEGNVLTLDLDSDENEVQGRHSESGTEKFELRYDGDKKMIYSKTEDYSLYSMANEDLQNHYSQSEIDYARIIMTINGEPSLDQWAVWNDDFGIPIVNVRYNSAGDPTEVSDEVPYPEDVTHLDSTNQGMPAGIITYSSISDGNIIRYPMPLHYHQEDQSEEGYRQLAQDALDDANTISIEPFEPYAVADFIGRVEFVYEE